MLRQPPQQPSVASVASVASAAASAAAPFTKDDKEKQSELLVVPWDNEQVIKFIVGQEKFAICRHTLEKIPALYRIIATNSSISSSSSSSKKYYVEGDEEAYQHVFAYARGNRNFLSSLSRGKLRILRHEAVKLEMKDLVADIDWQLNPQPDEKVLQTMDYNVRQMVNYLKLPIVHNDLMRNPYYHTIHDYIQSRANQHNHRFDDEVVAIVRNLATCKEFEFMVCSTTMPSVSVHGDMNNDQNAIPSKYFFHVVIDFFTGLLRFIAPMLAVRFLFSSATPYVANNSR